MEKGSERFDAIEQCLEERATVLQLSELSAKLDALVSRVEDLEDENKELKAQVCTCDKYEARVVPKEESDDGLSYATPEEESIRLPVPIEVLPAVSGQRCKPSKGHLISRIAFPSISPSGSGPTRSPTFIRKKRMEFSQVVSGLQSTRERFRRLRDWRRAAESAVDPGYFSDDSGSTDWSSLGRSSCSFTTSASDAGPAGGRSPATDRSIGYPAIEGGNRCGIGAGEWRGARGNLQGGYTTGLDDS
jgi:hypothetical protein